MSPIRARKPCYEYGCGELTNKKYCDKHLPLSKITLICGPPGSGKTTYVRKNARRGDLIFDLDWIWQSISGLPYLDKPDSLKPFVFCIRDAIYQRLTEESDLERAWIIVGAPTADERESLSERFKAEVILLKVPLDICIQRIQNDEKRPNSAEIIRPWIERWWSQYGDREKDIVIQ